MSCHAMLCHAVHTLCHAVIGIMTARVIWDTAVAQHPKQLRGGVCGVPGAARAAAKTGPTGTAQLEAGRYMAAQPASYR